MDKPKTICVKCWHFIGSKDSIWYDQYCSAVERTPAVDPVAGKKGFMGENAFGNKYYHSQQFEHARDINDGDCEHFKKKAGIFA